MARMAGGCLCGAIRYTTEAEPIFSSACHCRDCQRFTGSAFGALVALPKEALTFSGTMATFTSPGGSGKLVHRHFCPKCGSSMAEETEFSPGCVILNIGTLDEPKSVTMAREIFCDDALPWVRTAGNMQRFAKKPV
jgi:hypothetical protein